MPPPIPLKTTPPVAPKLAEINSKPLPSLKHLLPLPDEPKKASSSSEHRLLHLRRKTVDGVDVPASAKMLYYGAFQSFGPKYDSTDATIGYTSSVSQYRSERRIKQWETSVLSVEQNIPLRIGSKTFLLTAEESALLTALNLSPDLMVNQGIKGDANNLFVVEEELRRNEERLSVLMRGQWERLRTGKDVTVGAGVVENTTGSFSARSIDAVADSPTPYALRSSSTHQITVSSTRSSPAASRRRPSNKTTPSHLNLSDHELVSARGELHRWTGRHQSARGEGERDAGRSDVHQRRGNVIHFCTLVLLSR